MIRPQLVLDVNREIFIDNFAGGGGASLGIEMGLGRHVDHAVNHDPLALGMHRINHPQTVHHCENVFDIDPAEIAQGRRIGGAWFSPDCTHFSKAKGGKPLSKKIRGLALVMLRYANVRARVMYMENVEEIETWGPLLRSGRPDPRPRRANSTLRSSFASSRATARRGSSGMLNTTSPTPSSPNSTTHHAAAFTGGRGE